MMETEEIVILSTLILNTLIHTKIISKNLKADFFRQETSQQYLHPLKT